MTNVQAAIGVGQLNSWKVSLPPKQKITIYTNNTASPCCHFVLISALITGFTAICILTAMD